MTPHHAHSRRLPASLRERYIWGKGGLSESAYLPCRYPSRVWILKLNCTIPTTSVIFSNAPSVSRCAIDRPARSCLVQTDGRANDITTAPCMIAARMLLQKRWTGTDADADAGACFYNLCLAQIWTACEGQTSEAGGDPISRASQWEHTVVFSPLSRVYSSLREL